MKTTEHKIFNAFDKVLVRSQFAYDGIWFADLYSHYSNNMHYSIGMSQIDDYDIVPYEGNEHLLSTTDDPEEDVKLRMGEYIMVADKPNVSEYKWTLRKFAGTHKSTECLAAVALDDTKFRWKYAIRFSDFNPYYMEETKKHILCVRNGKVVRYKSE